MKHIKLILLLFVCISNLFAHELNKPFFDLGHKDSVSSIAVSPNQKLIASASSDHSIKLWDIETHKELKTFDLDFNWVDFISFSTDGQTLITGGNTNTIKFIDIKNGKIVDTFYDKNYKKGLVSSDRKIIAINEYGGTIKLLDTTTKKLIKKLKRDTDEIEVFAISLDGATLVTASEYSLITVWDIKSKKIVKTINLMQSTPYIKSIAIAPNKKTLLISGEAGIFKLFDIQSGKVLKEFSHQGNTSVDNLTFSIKGNTVVSSLNNTIKFWSKESDFFLGEIDLVSSLLFFPDNKTLALGFVNGTLGLLEMESGKIVKYFGSEMGFMGSPDISPDDKKLVVSKLDPISISILEIDTLKQSEPLKGHEEWITTLGYTPNGKNVVTTSADGDIIVWDIEKQTELLSLKNGTSAIDMIAFSNDSNILATWDRNSTITLWNLKEKNIIHTILCDKKSIYTIAFSPDGKIFAFGGTDKTIKLLDIQSGEIVKTLNSHLDYIGSIIFSKDGKTLISGSGDKKIKFWDIQSGKELEKSQIDVKDSINWLTFSPDESMIASSEGSDTINLWDIKTKKLLKTFQGLSIIKFNNNGKVLVTRSKDRMIQYWDITNGEEIATLVNFSDGEWIVITKEGYFNISSINAMNHLNILTNAMRVGGIDKENYQTFYRPDLVKLKLQGEDITRLIKQEDGKK